MALSEHAFSHWSGGSTQQSQLPVGGGGLHVQGSPEDELEADELADELDDTAELATDDDDAPDDELDELATAMPPPIPLDDDDATPEDELAALTELSDPVLVSEDDEDAEALADTDAERIDPPSPWLIGAGPKTSSPAMPPQLATQTTHKAIACFMRIVLPHPCAPCHGSSLTRGFHLTR